MNEGEGGTKKEAHWIRECLCLRGKSDWQGKTELLFKELQEHLAGDWEKKEVEAAGAAMRPGTTVVTQAN